MFLAIVRQRYQRLHIIYPAMIQSLEHNESPHVSHKKLEIPISLKTLIPQAFRPWIHLVSRPLEHSGPSTVVLEISLACLIKANGLLKHASRYVAAVIDGPPCFEKSMRPIKRTPGKDGRVALVPKTRLALRLDRSPLSETSQYSIAPLAH